MTRLFDFIGKYGHEATARRAHKALPDLAERDAARRAKSGVILGSEGPGGLDGFFADMELKRRFSPWWWNITLHIHWWMQKHGPRSTKNMVVAFWQRGKRGWADSDIWNFDGYLAEVIRDGINRLNETKHGWPGEPMTYEEWGQILTEIAEGMQAHLDLLDATRFDHQREIDLRAKRDLALDHMKAYWGNLWN